MEPCEYLHTTYLSYSHAYCLRSPDATSWNLLSTELPILYTPTGSNTTLRLTLKNHNAQNLNPSLIYNMTVLTLADIASSTAITHGNRYFLRSGEGNSTFAASYRPLNLQFMMTSLNMLPVYTVTDVLRGMQELAHYLLFLELAFEVFSDPDSTSPPIASGCLAYHCDSQTGGGIGTVQTRSLQYANFSGTNVTGAPSRQLQSSIAPIQLTTLDELEAVAVTYDDLKNPLPIHAQSFADVATRMLADITNLIIANQGDDLLPLNGHGNRRMFHYVDNWGSNLHISLLPWNLLGINFTLGQAAMALKTTQENISNRPMVESRLTITLDGSIIGWGCLSYGRLCMMPTAGSISSVGSRKESAFLERTSRC